MNLLKEIEKIKNEGYNEANAQARACQDVILYGISNGRLSRNVTIKGGVVMRNISKDARRATQDIDLDFIKYSISDDSIGAFIQRLHLVEDINEIIRRVERVFTNNEFIKEINKSKKNWMDISTEGALKRDIDFVKSLR